jgi:hypothetical protein
VFALYKKEATRVTEWLERNGYEVGCIQGDMTQEKRTKSLADFKDGKVQVLVATDVAARGLDIPKVELVINQTFPLTIEDYIHRIGRTGRAGRKGKSVTFFAEPDKAHAGQLIRVLKDGGHEVPEGLYQGGPTIKKVSSRVGDLSCVVGLLADCFLSLLLCTGVALDLRRALPRRHQGHRQEDQVRLNGGCLLCVCSLLGNYRLGACSQLVGVCAGAGGAGRVTQAAKARARLGDRAGPG